MIKSLLCRSAGALAFGLLAFAPLHASTTIGVLLKGRSDFWSAIEKGARDAAQKQGVEVIVKTPPAESDIAAQLALLRSMVAQGIQALVIAPDSKDALAGPVAAAEAKGIKIVVLDSPLAGDHVFVGTDHTNAGTVAGKFLATLVGEGDEVSFLKHSQTGIATNLREASAYTAIRAAHPNIVVHRDIFSGAEEGLEIEKAQLLLNRHPATKAILASGTSGTMAMLKVLEDTKRAGAVKLVGFGFDLNPEVASAIEHDALQGWVAQLPGEIGARGVDAAVSLIKGQTVPQTIACDFLLVTKENLKDPKVQALLTP